ncbi:MAG: hypothetical protein H7831_18280 [Magnetococcus sp. WYHC-3]
MVGRLEGDQRGRIITFTDREPLQNKLFEQEATEETERGNPPFALLPPVQTRLGFGLLPALVIRNFSFFRFAVFESRVFHLTKPYIIVLQ